MEGGRLRKCLRLSRNPVSYTDTKVTRSTRNISEIVRSHHNGIEREKKVVSVKGSIRLDGTILPKLRTTFLEEVSMKLNWTIIVT